MESGWKWDEKSLIGELIQGMELTKQLRAELSSASAAEENRGTLVQGILSSYEKALFILKWNGPMSSARQIVETTPGLPSSPISVNGSPSSDDSGRGLKDHQEDPRKESKKRKSQPRWTEQVKVNSETGFEGAHEDGYSWRKYGQKDILGARYPRSYYRCTFRSTQNCWAVKQVQRSEEDPYVFEITYRGKHNCSQGNYLAQSFHSPEKQEQKVDEHVHSHDHHQKQPFQENLLGNKTIEIIENLKNKASTSCFGSTSAVCKDIVSGGLLHSAIDTRTALGSFSQPLISPTTPDSNYTPTPCQKGNVEGRNVQQPESNVHDIFVANASATNSSILDWDFPFDSEPINSNFPFNSPGFFY